jgi:hypothetical protein
MPTRKVTKPARRKNATRRQRKPITHSRRRRSARPTRRIRKGGDRNAIYGPLAAEEARAVLKPENLKSFIDKDNLSKLDECIGKNCKEQSSSWADKWREVRNYPHRYHEVAPFKVNMETACGVCDTSLKNTSGTAVKRAMRLEN